MGRGSRAAGAGRWAIAGWVGAALALLAAWAFVAGWGPAAGTPPQGALSLRRRPPAPPPRPQPLPLEGVVVALDPGHGGEDGGVTHEGVREKDVNLAVALRLRDRLQALGARVVMTREGDEDALLDRRASLNVRLFKARQGEAQLLISIHANSFPDPSQWGAQTFYHPGSAEGRRLALLIQEELVRLEPDNYREALAADYYVLRHSEMPAALVEMGFLSNPEDRRKLVDPAHQARLAEALASAVRRFVAGERVESRPTAGRPLPPGFLMEIYPPEVR